MQWLTIPDQRQDKLRILQVATTFPLSERDPQPRFIRDLCDSLVKADDVDLKVLVPSSSDKADILEDSGYEVSRFRYFFNDGEILAYRNGILANLKSNKWVWFLVPFFMVGMYVGVIKQIRKFKPDIIHAHWWFPVGLAVYLAIISCRASDRCRMVVTCHGADYYVVGKKLKRLMRWVFSKAKAVLFVSNAMREDAEQECASSVFSVSPMGVDMDNVFVEKPLPRSGVLFVGRLADKKGVDLLIKAWSKIPEKDRSEGLTIVGGGDQITSLQALASRLEVTKTIEFKGPVLHSDLVHYYQRARFVVFPSLTSTDNDQEGLGLVPIEALACGCPILASDIGPMKDVVIDGVNGVYFKQGDELSLARALDQLLAPDSIRQLESLGAVARHSVLGKFSWNEISKNHIDLYRQVFLGR